MAASLLAMDLTLKNKVSLCPPPNCQISQKTLKTLWGCLWSLIDGNNNYVIFIKHTLIEVVESTFNPNCVFQLQSFSDAE